MKGEEFLLAEHRELIELYKDNRSNILYLGVSYVFGNGAMGSALFVLLSLEQPAFVKKGAVLFCLSLQIFASIFFFLFVKAKEVELTSLINKAIAIEDALQEKALPLDTFESCIVSIMKGEFLADSKEKYAPLKLWQKFNVIKGMCMVTIVFAFLGIVAATILFFSL